MPSSGDWRFQVDSSGFTELPFTEFSHTRRDRGVPSARVELPFRDTSGNKVIDTLSSDQEGRLQRYDGTNWKTKFGGYTQSGGEIREQVVIVKLLGYGVRAMETKVNPSFGSSKDNVELMTTLWSGAGGLSVRDPSNDGAVTTYTVSNYRLDDERKAGVYDLTQNYNWVSWTEVDTSDYAAGNSSNTIRYEPKGFRDSGKSFDTSTDNVLIESWEKGRIAQQTGEVRVIGTDTSGNKVTATAGSGEPFIRINAGYVESSSEAQDIADQVSNQSSLDGGRIQVNGIHKPIVNETLDLTDSQRNIDGTFRVTKQRNEYAGSLRTFLELGFAVEDEGVGKLAGRERRVRYRETRTTKQSGTSGTLDTGTSDHLGTKSGGVDDGGDTTIQSTAEITNLSTSQIANDGTWQTLANDIITEDDDTQGMFVWVNLKGEPGGSPADVGDFDDVDLLVRVKNTGSGDEFPIVGLGLPEYHRVFGIDDGASGSTWNSETWSVKIFVPENVKGNTYDVEAKLAVTSDEDFDINDGEVDAYTLKIHGHDDNIVVSDPGHGGTNDNSTHGVNGTVDTASEDKDNR